MSQATSVTVHRVLHLVEPTRVGSLSKTQRDATLVRALYSQLCAAITHPATVKGTVHCPANLGISYSGTFYDGSQALARFVYGATGCQTVSLTADGQDQDHDHDRVGVRRRAEAAGRPGQGPRRALAGDGPAEVGHRDHAAGGPAK